MHTQQEQEKIKEDSSYSNIGQAGDNLTIYPLVLQCKLSKWQFLKLQSLL